MTSVGSTAYYNSGSYSSGISKQNGTGGYDKTPEQRGSAATTTNPNSEAAVDNRPSTATVNFQAKLLTVGRVIDNERLMASSKPVWELSDDIFQKIVSTREMMLETQYRQFPEPPDLSNYGGTKPYANVVVGGRVVATIDNQGVVGTNDDELGKKLRGLSANATGRSGPELAQDLAEQIAKLLGGRVEKSDTALTQAEFDALPKPENPQPWIDYDAMRTDPEYTQIQDLKQKREEFLASQHQGALPV